MDFDNPFTTEVLKYAAYVLSLLIIFCLWGLFSPAINKVISKKTGGKVDSVFGQEFWRFFKAFAIAVGAIGLLGSFMGLEKILDDTYKPQLASYLKRDMSSYKDIISQIVKRQCGQPPTDQSFCASVPTAMQFVDQGLIDQQHGIGFIQNKIGMLPVDPQNQRSQELANRMFPAISMLGEKPSMTPTARLNYGVYSLYFLAFALAVSFGEAVFQYKLERDKPLTGLSLFRWLMTR